MKLFLLCAAGLGAALPACGSLESNTNRQPTLASIEGNLSEPSGVDIPTANDVRVAVVWRANGLDAQFNVAEDLPVQATFPASFSIALSAPPPQDAMNPIVAGVPVIYCIPDSGLPESPECPIAEAAESAGSPRASGAAVGGPPGEAGASAPEDDAEPPSATEPPISTTPATIPGTKSQYAVGTLVAYLDQNHNGKLDLVPDDAGAFVDQILATNEQLGVVYIEGPVTGALPFASVPDAYGHQPVDGYNLVSIPLCNSPLQASPSCANTPDAGACAPPEWLPIDTPYPLTVGTSPIVSRLMCADVSPSGTVGIGVPEPLDPSVQPAQYPTPSDPAVCCSSDGSQYTYTTCAADGGGLCEGVIETCASTGYARPTPVPAGWPCSD